MRTYSPYKSGGSLAWNDATYVSRQADSDLYRKVRQGRFCHVLGPHQTGKSSLRIRGRRRLEKSGYRCATVQATQISENLAHLQNDQWGTQWDKPFIASIWDSLYPSDTTTIVSWLEATAKLPPRRRLEHFTRDLLFPELSKKPLVIFIDEVDYFLGFPQAIHDFFCWIKRSCSLQDNRREYKTLSFVVLGSTTVESLKQAACNFDPDIAGDVSEILSGLFSTAGKVTLSNFELAETRPLQRGLTSKLNAIAALRAILKWTNGQPFLTQKLCRLLADQQIPDTPLSSPAALNRWVEILVKAHIVDGWQHQDDPVHLRNIRDRLQRSPHQKALHELYQQVASGRHVFYRGTRLQKELLMIGLVCRQNRQLQVTNQIYHHVFGAQVISAPADTTASASMSLADADSPNTINQFSLKKKFCRRRDRPPIFTLHGVLRPAEMLPSKHIFSSAACCADGFYPCTF